MVKEGLVKIEDKPGNDHADEGVERGSEGSQRGQRGQMEHLRCHEHPCPEQHLARVVGVL